MFLVHRIKATESIFQILRCCEKLFACFLAKLSNLHVSEH